MVQSELKRASGVLRYRVREAGWYAVDDNDKVVLGPFDSLAECDRAIRDRLLRIGSPASD